MTIAQAISDAIVWLLAFVLALRSRAPVFRWCSLLRL